MERLEAAGLRGMGGAGFPTGMKWSSGRGGGTAQVRRSATPTRPSRARSRTARSSPTQPHLMFEGMLLAMYVVGADEGIVFVRHEYGPEERSLRAELEPRAQTGCSATTS